MTHAPHDSAHSQIGSYRRDDLIGRGSHAAHREVHGVLHHGFDGHVDPNGLPPRICSYHNLRHRRNGRYLWVDFHVNVPAQTPIRDAHALASAIEHEIEQSFGEADATAHVEDCRDKACSHVPLVSSHDRQSEEPSPV